MVYRKWKCKLFYVISIIILWSTEKQFDSKKKNWKTIYGWPIFLVSSNIKGVFGYRLFTENWKHCSKIIFKGVNSSVEPKNALVCTFLAGSWTVPWDSTKNANTGNAYWPLCKRTLWVYLDTAYFAETENLLLKVL